MAQITTLNLGNVDGRSVQTWLNERTESLDTKNSGPTVPNQTRQYINWVDTSGSTPKWLVRNTTNDAWVEIGNPDARFLGLFPDPADANVGDILTITDNGERIWAPAKTSSGESNIGTITYLEIASLLSRASGDSTIGERILEWYKSHDDFDFSTIPTPSSAELLLGSTGSDADSYEWKTVINAIPYASIVTVLNNTELNQTHPNGRRLIDYFRSTYDLALPLPPRGSTTKQILAGQGEDTFWEQFPSIPDLPNASEDEDEQVLKSRTGNAYWGEINEVPDTPGTTSGIGHVLTVTGESDGDFAWRSLPTSGGSFTPTASNLYPSVSSIIKAGRNINITTNSDDAIITISDTNHSEPFLTPDYWLLTNSSRTVIVHVDIDALIGATQIIVSLGGVVIGRVNTVTNQNAYSINVTEGNAMAINQEYNDGDSIPLVITFTGNANQLRSLIIGRNTSPMTFPPLPENNIYVGNAASRPLAVPLAGFFNTATPSSIAETGSPGTTLTTSRGDHTHALPIGHGLDWENNKLITTEISFDEVQSILTTTDPGQSEANGLRLLDFLRTNYGIILTSPNRSATPEVLTSANGEAYWEEIFKLPKPTSDGLVLVSTGTNRVKWGEAPPSVDGDPQGLRIASTTFTIDESATITAADWTLTPDSSGNTISNTRLSLRTHRPTSGTRDHTARIGYLFKITRSTGGGNVIDSSAIYLYGDSDKLTLGLNAQIVSTLAHGSVDLSLNYGRTGSFVDVTLANATVSNEWSVTTFEQEYTLDVYELNIQGAKGDKGDLELGDRSRVVGSVSDNGDADTASRSDHKHQLKISDDLSFTIDDILGLSDSFRTELSKFGYADPSFTPEYWLRTNGSRSFILRVDSSILTTTVNRIRVTFPGTPLVVKTLAIRSKDVHVYPVALTSREVSTVSVPTTANQTLNVTIEYLQSDDTVETTQTIKMDIYDNPPDQDVHPEVYLTQAEYNALTTKDSNTYYNTY